MVIRRKSKQKRNRSSKRRTSRSKRASKRTSRRKKTSRRKSKKKTSRKRKSLRKRKTSRKKKSINRRGGSVTALSSLVPYALASPESLPSVASNMNHKDFKKMTGTYDNSIVDPKPIIRAPTAGEMQEYSYWGSGRAGSPSAEAATNRHGKQLSPLKQLAKGVMITGRDAVTGAVTGVGRGIKGAVNYVGYLWEDDASKGTDAAVQSPDASANTYYDPGNTFD